MGVGHGAVLDLFALGEFNKARDRCNFQNDTATKRRFSLTTKANKWYIQGFAPERKSSEIDDL